MIEEKERTISRLARASTWSAVDGLIRAILGFGVSIVLARLVAPREFGAVAVIVALSAIAGVIVDFGLSSALIRRQDATHAEESTVFYFNFACSLAMAGGLAIAAPWVAGFYSMPELSGITLIFAASLLITSAGSIHITLLTKRLEFRPMVFIGLWSWLLAGSTAILLAWNGFGAWSLAWQAFAQSLASTVLLWRWHSWKPLWTFRPMALRQLMQFGAHVMTANVIDAAYTRIYTIAIGKFVGLNDLGYYTRAQSLQQLPTTLLTSVLNRVALPTFSRSAHDPVLLSADLSTASSSLMLLNMPLMAGIAALADPLIRVLFGNEWGPSAPLLQALAIVGAVWPLQVLNVTTLLAQGHSRLVLRIEIPKKIVGATLLLTACPFGLKAIVWGQAVAALINFFINAHYSGRLLGFGAIRQLRSLSPIVAATAIMLASLLSFRQVAALSPAWEVAAAVPLATFVYVAASIALTPRRTRDATLLLIRQLYRTPSDSHAPSGRHE